jgi:hypothetical protein
MMDAKVIQLDRKACFVLFCELEARSSKEWLVRYLLGHCKQSALSLKELDAIDLVRLVQTALPMVSP